MRGDDKVVARYHRLGRLFVALMPAKFRKRFGEAIEETLLEGLHDHDGLGRFWFASISYLNIFISAIRERIAPTTIRRVHPYESTYRTRRGATVMVQRKRDSRVMV